MLLIQDESHNYLSIGHWDIHWARDMHIHAYLPSSWSPTHRIAMDIKFFFIFPETLEWKLVLGCSTAWEVHEFVHRIVKWIVILSCKYRSNTMHIQLCHYVKFWKTSFTMWSVNAYFSSKFWDTSGKPNGKTEWIATGPLHPNVLVLPHTAAIPVTLQVYLLVYSFSSKGLLKGGILLMIPYLPKYKCIKYVL